MPQHKAHKQPKTNPVIRKESMSDAIANNNRSAAVARNGLWRNPFLTLRLLHLGLPFVHESIDVAVGEIEIG